MSDLNPNQDLNRRHTDSMMVALNQRFNDFVERYDRDVGALGEWRRNVDIKIDDHGKILAEISPAYFRGKWVVALAMIGSVGLAVKAFWAHIKWQ
jgi:hypothetical protein